MENKKYYINFGTGEGNRYADTLEGAKEIAEKECAYTQQSIEIYEDETAVARLPWWGIEAQEDDIVTASFGDFGFYGEWIDCNG